MLFFPCFFKKPAGRGEVLVCLDSLLTFLS
jgi:hypothetical protein